MAAVQYLSWIYLSPILFVPNPLCPIMRFAIQRLFPQSPTPWGNERRYVYTFLSLIVDLKDPLFWAGSWSKWGPILFNEISRSFNKRGTGNVAIWTFRLMHYFKTLFLKIGFYYRRLAGSFALLLLIYIQSATEIHSSTTPTPRPHNDKTSVTMRISCS